MNRKQLLLLSLSAYLAFSDCEANAQSEKLSFKIGNPSGIKIVGSDTETHVGYFLSQLKQTNPQYEFSFFDANVPRILAQMRQTDNTCFMACLEDRSRLKYVYWTPYGLMPPPVVLINKARAEKLKLAGTTLSLKDLVQIPDIIGSISLERSYGPQVDEILKNSNGGNLQRNPQDFIAVNVLSMIAKGRVDYTIDHRSTLEVHSNLSTTDIAVFEIEEAKKEMVTYFACSRSEQGKKLITDVDELIRKNVNTAEYQKKIIEPLFSKNKSESYLRAWKAFAQERSKSSQIE
ncbi:hypothetical protein [Bdellovibrio sp. HCB274]|uniref:hypothetical protein n=1 Tax=Bdellovibrio sp. HCB274 TaxID=3394361 RepID=UPI0039B59B74